jgi:hypothetical protein
LPVCDSLHSDRSRKGASFETVSLDVTPRVTLGLLKQGGRWAVTHEHHSFTDKT